MNEVREAEFFDHGPLDTGIMFFSARIRLVCEDIGGYGIHHTRSHKHIYLYDAILWAIVAAFFFRLFFVCFRRKRWVILLYRSLDD